MRNTIAFAISSLIAARFSLVAAQPTPPPEPETEQGAEATVSGTVTGYTTTSRGNMDGIILNNGTTVHFPPYVGARVLPLVRRGEQVTVTGTAQAGPAGRVLEATAITNTESGRTLYISALSPLSPTTQQPPPPAGAVPPPDQHRPPW